MAHPPAESATRRCFPALYIELSDGAPPMKTLVLAAGGLGRTVVDAAARAEQEVRAFVRQVRGDPLPPGVQVFEGDATRQEDVTRAMRGVDAAYFCLNPRFAGWLDDFPPLLATAIA